MQAIMHKLPFVLVAPPLTLKYIKEAGFRTFDEFWDESYDEETIHSKRMLKIFGVIDYINSKTLHELQVIIERMAEILNHNFVIFLSIQQKKLSQ